VSTLSGVSYYAKGTRCGYPRRLLRFCWYCSKEKAASSKRRVDAEGWPDAVVEENNLTVNISALRRSLTESPGEHRYVVTVPGRGYQFVRTCVSITATRRRRANKRRSPKSMPSGQLGEHAPLSSAEYIGARLDVTSRAYCYF